MPIYGFICNDCGNTTEIFQHGFKKKTVKCKCGKRMKRVLGNVNTDLVSNPRWSRALGVNISQIPEARRLWPDWKFNEKGDVLVESRNDKLKKMKARGMAEIE